MLSVIVNWLRLWVNGRKRERERVHNAFESNLWRLSAHAAQSWVPGFMAHSLSGTEHFRPIACPESVKKRGQPEHFMYSYRELRIWDRQTERHGQTDRRWWGCAVDRSVTVYIWLEDPPLLTTNTHCSTQCSLRLPPSACPLLPHSLSPMCAPLQLF